MTTTPATLLVQLDAPALGPNRCQGWNNVATAVPIQIAIVSDKFASPAIARAGGDLFDEINSILGASGALSATPPCSGASGTLPWQCGANRNPSTHHVLAYVTDGSTNLDPYYLAWVSSRSVTPIPILPVGTLPATALPSVLRGNIALFFGPAPHAVKALASSIILRATDLGGRRLFISYRHDEAGAIAEQVFDALTHAAYDVFLDRFRGQPGQDFMERIREELVAKRCVLVLETPMISQSSYVIGEVATAKRFRLGLMAVDLPGSRQVFRDIAPRLDLRRAAGVTAGSAAATLASGDIQRIVSELVDRYYVAETARRWRFQRLALQKAAIAARLSVRECAVGVFQVAGTSVSAVCMANVLPIDASAFKRMDDAGAGSPQVLFGPIQAQGGIARGEIDWLATKTAILPRDEGQMLRTMHRIRRGVRL